MAQPDGTKVLPGMAGKVSGKRGDPERTGQAGYIVPVAAVFTPPDAEGTFVWADGDAASYTNWATGEPNDEFGEDFAAMWNVAGATLAHSWNDFANITVSGSSASMNGVVEVIPEPSTALLFGFGLVSLTLAGRRGGASRSSRFSLSSAGRQREQS